MPSTSGAVCLQISKSSDFFRPKMNKKKKTLESASNKTTLWWMLLMALVKSRLTNSANIAKRPWHFASGNGSGRTYLMLSMKRTAISPTTLKSMEDMPLGTEMRYIILSNFLSLSSQCCQLYLLLKSWKLLDFTIHFSVKLETLRLIWLFWVLFRLNVFTVLLM